MYIILINAKVYDPILVKSRIVSLLHFVAVFGLFQNFVR